ncbi:MAG: extracellular solute-binding protein [Chloroflexi bacterium]|nr:extracellular solute-binding protein [Chloroflexota bacterium]
MRKLLFFGVFLALLLVACAPKATPTPAPPKAEGELVIMGQAVWEVPYRENYFPKFEAETGCKITWFGARSADILARLTAEKASPSIDIGQMDQGPWTQAKALGLLAKFDRNIVTGLDKLFPEALDPDDTGVPHVFWGTGITIRKDKLEAAGIPKPTSWLDLGDPRYKGHLGVQTIETTGGPATIYMIAKALGKSPPEDNGDAALDFLRDKVKPNLLLIGGGGDIDQLLTQGDVWISNASTLRSVTLYDAGVPVEVIIPKEGLPLDTNGFQFVKGAPHPMCAQLWLKFVITKEAQSIAGQPGSKLTAAPVHKEVTLPPGREVIIPYGEALAKAGIARLPWVKVQEVWPKWTERWNKEFTK